MSQPEYKTLEVKELTAEGQLEAVISTFGRDRDGDVMTRDAFKDSEGKAIPMVWSHNWDQPVGKGTVSVTSKGAVLSGQFFLDTERGREAHATVRAMGDLQQYSIGFRVTDADFGYQEDDEGQRVYTRTIKGLELFEASPVLVGAAYNTGTVAVKTAAVLDKRAIPSHTTSTDDSGEWDGPAAVSEAPNERAALRHMHAWVDAEGDPDAKSSYKFPHHTPGTDTPAVIAAVNNALARLPQSDIPDSDRAAVERHLRAHRSDAGLEEDGLDLRLVELGLNLDSVKQAAEVEDKAGRRLSSSTREAIESAIGALRGLLDQDNANNSDDDDDSDKDLDLPDLVTPERQEQLRELEEYLATVKL